ncbi:helix-turn-helix transcriptional regulator [Nonomuraea sp. NPDC005692]|uniref:PadR family transcriptional regulator n=1 Tax=Nonomuraea sp. NPDC005692 TaxID=3157168 RepID=UPI0033C0EA7B
MGSLPRMTMPTMLVLHALLEDPARAMYGLEIRSAAELPSGTIHPILARLEGFGWLESSWEELDPREEGRPRRRYYRFTSDGAQLARQALDRAAAKRAALRLRPSEGVA